MSEPHKKRFHFGYMIHNNLNLLNFLNLQIIHSKLFAEHYVCKNLAELECNVGFIFELIHQI